jgi:hypothetical protein
MLQSLDEMIRYLKAKHQVDAVKAAQKIDGALSGNGGPRVIETQGATVTPLETKELLMPSKKEQTLFCKMLIRLDRQTYTVTEVAHMFKLSQQAAFVILLFGLENGLIHKFDSSNNGLKIKLYYTSGAGKQFVDSQSDL